MRNFIICTPRQIIRWLGPVARIGGQEEGMRPLVGPSSRWEERRPALQVLGGWNRSSSHSFTNCSSESRWNKVLSAPTPRIPYVPTADVNHMMTWKTIVCCTRGIHHFWLKLTVDYVHYWTTLSTYI
jgi:hypothetical protein